MLVWLDGSRYRPFGLDLAYVSQVHVLHLCTQLEYACWKQCVRVCVCVYVCNLHIFVTRKCTHAYPPHKGVRMH